MAEFNLTAPAFLLEYRSVTLYQEWLNLGNEGTMADFIAWLRTPATEAAAQALQAAAAALDAAQTLGQGIAAAEAAATLANTKAGLANDAAILANEKAALVDSAATLANTKAGLANDAAILATEKASLADSKATLANDKAILAQSAADNANAKAAEVTAAVLSAGSLGSIKPTDSAPTPARNGNYTFSIGGNKPAWLTAEAGVTTVKAGDGVAVVYTAPSSYTYTHIAIDTKITNRFPFAQSSSFFGVDKNTYEKAIIDAEIIGGNENWRVGLFTLNRNGIYGWHIRLAVYSEDDTLISSIGQNGVICEFISSTYTEPSPVNGRIVTTIVFDRIYENSITSAKIIVDWSALAQVTDYGVNSYNKIGFDQKIFNNSNLKASKNEILNSYKYLPRAEEKIWSRANLFSLGNLKEVILDCEIYGVSDKTKRYGIEMIRFTPSANSRSFIGIREFSSTGVAGARVCLFDNVAYTPPVEVNGKRIAELTLSQVNASGITAVLTVDWAKVPTSGTGWAGTYWYSNAFTVTDGEFSYNAFRNGSSASGVATIVFQIDGVNCQIITPTAYSKTGQKTRLLMLCHGNGQSYTYAGSTNFKNYCKDHNIAIATTAGQDQTTAPFTSQASGWGNQIHIKRYLKLYNYLMSNYNLHTDVILSCGSMGGLVAGHFAYTRPFPISLCLFAGPVPDLSYIFANGGASRQAIIRNSFGMAADGSDDANLETFISGYDWFDMGMITVSGTKYKVGFPRMYIYAGTGDTTFSVDFGGTAKFTELITSLRNAGGFVVYKEIAGATHADDLCFDRMISDNVMSLELGL